MDENIEKIIGCVNNIKGDYLDVFNYFLTDVLGKDSSDVRKDNRFDSFTIHESEDGYAEVCNFDRVRSGTNGQPWLALTSHGQGQILDYSPSSLKPGDVHTSYDQRLDVDKSKDEHVVIYNKHTEEDGIFLSIRKSKIKEISNKL
jgi:hypothetical protein